MNILPFVLAMLMLISIMTYAKLQVFLGNASLQMEYACSMKSQEIFQINLAQLKLYQKKERGTDKNSKKDHEKEEALGESGRVEAQSTLNFRAFIDKTAREKSPDHFQAQYAIIKRLIEQLYYHQPFFIQAQQMRGDIVDQLLEAMMEKSQEPQYQDKITQVKHLANIDLENPELQNILIEMLKGYNQAAEILTCGSKSKRAKKIIHTYPSLQDFLNVQKAQPLRLWLAPKEILLAIFDDESFVESMMKSRMEIYRKLKKFQNQELKLQRQVASQDFKALFLGKIPPNTEQLLNFQATTTAPP